MLNKIIDKGGMEIIEIILQIFEKREGYSLLLKNSSPAMTLFKKRDEFLEFLDVFLFKIIKRNLHKGSSGLTRVEQRNYLSEVFTRINYARRRIELGANINIVFTNLLLDLYNFSKE